jgi:hypothetical protein
MRRAELDPRFARVCDQHLAAQISGQNKKLKNYPGKVALQLFS